MIAPFAHHPITAVILHSCIPALRAGACSLLAQHASVLSIRTCVVPPPCLVLLAGNSLMPSNLTARAEGVPACMKDQLTSSENARAFPPPRQMLLYSLTPALRSGAFTARMGQHGKAHHACCSDMQAYTCMLCGIGPGFHSFIVQGWHACMDTHPHSLTVRNEMPATQQRVLPSTQLHPGAPAPTHTHGRGRCSTCSTYLQHRQQVLSLPHQARPQALQTPRLRTWGMTCTGQQTWPWTPPCAGTCMHGHGIDTRVLGYCACISTCRRSPEQPPLAQCI